MASPLRILYVMDPPARILVDKDTTFAFMCEGDRRGHEQYYCGIEDLFVDPEVMRQGIGRALIADAVAAARHAGVGRIEVTANEHALAFYEEVGFVWDGVADTRFGPAPDMHLDIGPARQAIDEQ